MAGRELGELASKRGGIVAVLKGPDLFRDDCIADREMDLEEAKKRFKFQLWPTGRMRDSIDRMYPAQFSDWDYDQVSCFCAYTPMNHAQPLSNCLQMCQLLPVLICAFVAYLFPPPHSFSTTFLAAVALPIQNTFSPLCF